MGNISSVSDGDDRSRSALTSIENVEGFRTGDVSRTSDARASTRRPSRKRTRTHPIPRSHTPPAGSTVDVGTIGTRWPIPGRATLSVNPLDMGTSSGVAAEIRSAQGQLELKEHASSEGTSVVYWRLDTEPYASSASSLPRLISSSSFRIHPIGTRLLWRLTIAPKDYRDDAISVYVESMNGHQGEPFLIETRFALTVAMADQSLDPQTLREAFDPVPGIHNVATFAELLESRTRRRRLLTVGLYFYWPELYMISASPKIYMVEHFLTMDECEALIEVAAPLLYRSRVSSGTETPSRTSSSMFFTGNLNRVPVVKTVEEKLLRLIDRPEIHEGRRLKPNESLQAVRYRMGEFYAEHYDVRQGQSHMRAATLIVYLRDTEAGGATYFPLASGQLPGAEQRHDASYKKQDGDADGLRIYPRRGRAIFFWSRTDEGKEDKASLHAAEPIIMGEKWIATRWLRELDPL